MITTKVTQRGQTVVPSAIRKAFKIDDHSTLIWSTDGKTITVVPAPENPIASLRGSTRGKDLRKALLRAREEDAKRG